MARTNTLSPMQLPNKINVVKGGGGYVVMVCRSPTAVSPRIGLLRSNDLSEKSTQAIVLGQLFDSR